MKTASSPGRVVVRCLPALLLALAFVSTGFAHDRADPHRFAPVVEMIEATVPSPDPLAPALRAWLKNHGPIVYAPDPSFPPFEYIDSSGKAVGITPDILRIISSQLGVPVKIAHYTTWSKVLEAVKSGEVDLLGTLTKTPEREKYLTFSDPYLSVPYVLFVRQDTAGVDGMDSLAGRRFGVVKGYGINNWLAANHPGLTPVEVATASEGLTRLSTGELDAMLETLPVGNHLIREESLTNVKISPAHIYTLPQHFGVALGEGEITAIVQQGLRGLTGDQKTRVYLQWTGQDFERQPQGLSPFWRNALLGLVGALLLGLTWIWTLRRSIEAATRAQRASEERYTSLVELAADTILRGDPKGMIISANKSAEALTGYTVEELLDKKDISILFTPEEQLRAPLRYDLLKEGRTVRTERNLTRKDGSIVPIDMNTNMMPDGTYQTFMRDMTEQKRAEEVLRASEEKFSLAFRSAPLLISISELETGVYSEVNEKFCQVTGFTKEEVIGRSSLEIATITREQRSKILEEIRKKGGVRDLELDLRSKEGVPINCIYSAELISIGGTLQLLSIALDVTEKKRLQEELNKTQRLESLGLLAGGIAHDFNNLLTGILGNISLAKSLGGFGGQALKCLDESEKGSLRAAALVSQLLTFSRGGTPKKKVLRPAPLIEEAAGLVLRGSGARAALKISPELKNIEADEGQITQTLHNLLINASQAMEGRGVITIGAVNVELPPGNSQLLAPGEYVRITVEDQGPGISEGNLAKIFDPYYTTKTYGTGLGLATVHSIITRHSGRIAAGNVPGSGARFTIHLPASEKPGSEEEGAKNGAASAGSGRVLVMDDEKAIRDVLKTMLAALGYTPVSVADGEEALCAIEQAKLTNEPYVAAILDLTIPGGMGGLEAALKIQALAPEVRLLVSSGYSDDAALAEYESHGFHGAIPKPYKLAELSQELKKALERGNAAEEKIVQ